MGSTSSLDPFAAVSPSGASLPRIFTSWEAEIGRSARSWSRTLHSGATDADDLAQEARLHLEILERRSGAPAAGAMRTIIRNVIVSAVRRAQRSDRLLPTSLPPDFDVAGSPEDRSLRDAVAARVRRLPARLHRVYRGLYVDGLTQRELAAQMRLSASRVSQLHDELLRAAKPLLRDLAA